MKRDSKVTLGGLFYPSEDERGNPISFDSLFIPYIYKEIYLEGVYNDILLNRKDMVIIDAGANIGIVTQYMRQYAKKIYAIEPSPEHFAALKQNKEFNHWDNVEIFNVALADKVGEAQLAQNEHNRTMNSIMVGEKMADGRYALDGDKWSMGTLGIYGEDRITVKTIDFETFFKENKIDQVDFCKFDVEGADDLVLRSEGFKKVADKIKAIEVEFHFPNWMDLAGYLTTEFGYQARRYESSAVVVLFTK